MNLSGMTTMAEALPFFIRFRPSASSLTVTSNIFFIWSASKAPRKSFEARPLSWSTRTTWMGGSVFSSSPGAKMMPMSAVMTMGMTMKMTMASGDLRCRRTSFPRTRRSRRMPAP